VYKPLYVSANVYRDLAAVRSLPEYVGSENANEIHVGVCKNNQEDCLKKSD